MWACAGGQVLSAVIGCTVHLFLGHIQWLSGAVGMSLSLVAMMLTRTTHPVRPASPAQWHVATVYFIRFAGLRHAVGGCCRK